MNFSSKLFSLLNQNLVLQDLIPLGSCSECFFLCDLSSLQCILSNSAAISSTVWFLVSGTLNATYSPQMRQNTRNMRKQKLSSFSWKIITFESTTGFKSSNLWICRGIDVPPEWGKASPAQTGPSS